MKNILKIILYNFLIFFSLIGLLFFIPPIIHTIYEHFIKKESYVHLYKSNLPNYQNTVWAKEHFKEYSSLNSKYFDYYGWRRADFAGETINIKDGLRQTVQSKEINNDFVLWFFGGSTMWGTGVNDENTLPSLMAKDTNYFSINFGESGYTSRQSLAYLNNLYILQKNHQSRKKVIFLDGVNDVIANCSKDIKNIESYYQRKIRKMFSEKLSSNSLSFKNTFEQWRVFIEKLWMYFNLNNKNNFEANYDCHINDTKAKNVANYLVDSWINAKALVESRGDQFFAVLQPNSFIGVSDLRHIKKKRSINCNTKNYTH